MKIAVIGTGTWGMALARVLKNAGHSVIMWSHDAEKVKELDKTRIHEKLGNMVIPSKIEFTEYLGQAVESAEIIIIAVSSPYVRHICKQLKLYIKIKQIIVTVTKGMEKDSLYTMSEVIEEELGKLNSVVALSGPTHAEEVAKDMPTLIVSASEDEKAAKTVQSLFDGTCIRPYTNTDIKGVELCGAMKNAEALAVGIAAGLGYGDNTRAALITRGMAEITRLGKAMNCDEKTFAGLAGMGDLIVTATSSHSRNNRAGMLIGKGVSAKEAVEQIGMVVEGINVLPAAMQLSEKYKVEIPIISVVNDIVNNGMAPQKAVASLLGRSVKPEK